MTANNGTLYIYVSDRMCSVICRASSRSLSWSRVIVSRFVTIEKKRLVFIFLVLWTVPLNGRNDIRFEQTVLFIKCLWPSRIQNKPLLLSSWLAGTLRHRLLQTDTIVIHYLWVIVALDKWWRKDMGVYLLPRLGWSKIITRETPQSDWIWSLAR